LIRHPDGVVYRKSGFTAIEATVALLVVSFLSIFALQVHLHLQSAQIEIQQVDTAVQIARDVLNDLKAESDWRAVEERVQPVNRYDTDFTIQLQPLGSSVEGLVDLELTISWIGARGIEQMVFSTTVPDVEAG
jgi:type II secretory pathway pseudopilin PulG